MWVLDLNFVVQVTATDLGDSNVLGSAVWKSVTPRFSPGPLSHASVCVLAKKAFIYGGIRSNEESNSKLLAFDSVHEQWEVVKAKGTPPGALDEHTAVIRDDGKMFIFGGFGPDGELTNDTFIFNVNNYTWLPEKSPSDCRPKPRAGHSALLLRNKMYVFGGKGGDCIKYNDLWIFDTHYLTWEQVYIQQDIESWIPEERSGQSMFNYKGKIVVYGGMHHVLHELGDLSIFDPVDT